MDEIDLDWMKVAMSLARGAGAIDEVPVGALVVRNGSIIASGINCREANNDPTGHAEIVAIRSASRYLDSWRLENCTLYITLEPCLMCAGAIYLSRIPRVVYGACEPKSGAYETLYNIASDTRLNHCPTVTGGLMAAQSSDLLRQFFRSMRAASPAQSAKRASPDPLR